MIREFKYEDTKELIQITNKGLIIDETEIIDIINDNDKQLIVYDEDGIKGFGLIRITDNESKRCDIKLYVDPKERKKGIGTALYKEVDSYLQKITPNLLITEFRVDKDDPSYFYKKLGYKKWYICHELHYKGTFQPNNDIEFIHYTDKYYEQYVKCIQDSFYELRKENDIHPYTIPFQFSKEDRESMLKRKEFKYIALNNEQIIAAFDLADGWIDLVLVSPAYQGKGYGKKAVQYAINEALSQTVHSIRLNVIGSNNKAINLYKSLGFETVQTIHVYRQFGNR